jgi:GTP diphosphokinase / guanosine-3',5'-bis(diphosphate) 3'-diphosphatase
VGTVDRVLPWRRQHVEVANSELTPLLASYRRRHPKSPVSTISRAYRVAADAHRSQMRSSGESYINHPLAVAQIVADIGLDEVSVTAALLHDAVEDTEITVADVERDFGSEVAAIVDGVTKLERIRFDSREEQQAASMRKMLVAMAKDLRVLVIKLADRLHNMRTIAAMPLEKQQRIAQETLDIYAPLAHRLGMQEMKQQLEDLAFAALHPKRFAELDHLVSSRTPERDLYLAKTLAEVRARLDDLGIKAEVTGRGKHLWSIYEKMVVKGREFDEIFDLIAIRVVVDSMKDCYAALGSIHGRWRPVVGRFKDYIAMPKFNLYQSLHTTVIGPAGKPIEVQIRTHEMHQRAEWGVAAHWAYKEGSEHPADIDWLSRIIDWQEEVSDPAQFMQSLKTDLEQDEVFVFTPKGQGDHVAGRMRPPSTSPMPCTPRSAMPASAPRSTAGWCRSTTCWRAVTTSRSSPRRSRPPDRRRTGSRSSCRLGRATRSASGSAVNVVSTWSRRVATISRPSCGASAWPCSRCGSRLNCERSSRSSSYVDLDALLAAIGEHHVSAKSVAQRLARAFHGDAGEQLPATVSTPRRQRRDGHETPVGVHVEGTRRRARPAGQLLHAGARRRDHRLRHPRARRERAPRRLRERSVALGRTGHQDDRGRMGSARCAPGAPSSPASRWSRSIVHDSCATSPTRSPITTSTSCRARRSPGATGSPRCASSSSSPIPATSTPCCARSSPSTRCTTHIA